LHEAIVGDGGETWQSRLIDGEMWFHTDKCCHRCPHRASFLYGIEIPSAGGHTKFSSMYAAYDRLPADLKRRLDGAMVMQGQQYGVGRRIDVTLPLESTHHCRQPIFVTNPGSARKALLRRGIIPRISPCAAVRPTRARHALASDVATIVNALAKRSMTFRSTTSVPRSLVL
jgi:hypothetical protein